MGTSLLQDLKLGLLNWYDFKTDAKILCVGTESKIFFDEWNCTTDNPLLDYIESIDAVADEPKKLYDYIISVGELERALEPVSFLKQLKEKLEEDGHLLLAVENRLGLRYFCGDRDSFSNRVFDGIEGYRNFSAIDIKNMGGRNYARYELKDFLEKVCLKYQFYSILPGLEMPQQIYSEDYIPREELEIRYTPYYHYPDSVFLNECQMYSGVVKNGMFHQMANAYLIDCVDSLSEADKSWNINSVTTSMDRGRSRATATIIRKDNTVLKKALYMEGNEAIEALLANTEKLVRHGIPVVPMKKNGPGSCVMDYIKSDTALTYLRELVKEDSERFVSEVERFINLILNSSEPVENEDVPQNPELGVYYKDVYIDLVPLNCFYKDGEYLFFDQEYVVHNYPINAVLIRALDIIYMNDKTINSIVPESYFLEKYGLTDKADAYRAMGTIFIDNLRNKEELKDFNNKKLPVVTDININRQRINYSQREYQRLFCDFLKDVKDKEIYIFGAGLWARKFIAEYGSQYKILGAIDNNKANLGNFVEGIPVISPDKLVKHRKENLKVIICVKNYTSIAGQLESIGIRNYGIYDPYLDIATESDFASSSVPVPVNATGENETIAEIKKYKTGYVAGVFDLFHVGHLNLLRRAKMQCEYLIVGVVSDEQASKGKNHSPYVSENERVEIVRACRYVDEAFILPYVSSGTRDVYKKYHFDVQFSGSDYEHDPNWIREQEWLRKHGSDLVFFPYTMSTSSTKLKEAINKQ